MLRSLVSPFAHTLNIAAFAVVLLAAHDAGATIYNFESEFSLANNPNGAWSYRYQSDGVPNNAARDGSYELLPSAISNLAGWSGINGWGYAPDVLDLPAVAINTNGGTFTSGAFSVPSGQSVLHPNFGPQITVVTWTATEAGWIDIAYRFTDLDSSGDTGVLWFVDLNATNLAGAALSEGADTGLLSLTNITVNPGDQINFILDPNVSYSSDATRLFAEIDFQSSIPEPGTLTLVGLSLVVAARRRRAKTRHAGNTLKRELQHATP